MDEEVAGCACVDVLRWRDVVIAAGTGGGRVVVKVKGRR